MCRSSQICSFTCRLVGSICIPKMIILLVLALGSMIIHIWPDIKLYHSAMLWLVWRDVAESWMPEFIVDCVRYGHNYAAKFKVKDPHWDHMMVHLCYVSVTMSTWSLSPIINTIITLIWDVYNSFGHPPNQSRATLRSWLPQAYYHPWVTLSSSLLWAHYHWHILLGYVICHLSVLVTDVGLLSHHWVDPRWVDIGDQDDP